MKIDFDRPENCFGFVARTILKQEGVIDLDVADIENMSLLLPPGEDGSSDLVVVKQYCPDIIGDNGTYWSTHHVALRDPKTGLSPFAEEHGCKHVDECEEYSASEGFCPRRSRGEKILRAFTRGASLKQRDGFGKPIRPLTLEELQKDPTWSRDDFFIELRKIKQDFLR